MYVSYDDSFVFFHVPRTGGASIIDALSENHEVFLQLGAHEDLTTLIEKAGKDSLVLNEFMKFAFVRNPWDRLVSAYYYLLDAKELFDRRIRDLFVKQYNGFSEFVKHIDSWFDASLSFGRHGHKRVPYFRQQHHYILDPDGRVTMDFLGRYEKFEEDSDYICDILALNVERPLCHNESVHLPYQEYYDDETMNLVATYYKDDIVKFNYSF